MYVPLAPERQLIGERTTTTVEGPEVVVQTSPLEAKLRAIHRGMEVRVTAGGPTDLRVASHWADLQENAQMAKFAWSVVGVSPASRAEDPLTLGGHGSNAAN